MHHGQAAICHGGTDTTSPSPDVYVGLYYPYIHFRDESWLKLAALYWDKMARIVPYGYPIHDSDTVKRLANDLDLIRNLAPGYETEQLGAEFLEFLRANEGRLRERYSVPPGQAVEDGGRGRMPGVAFIFWEKIDAGLQDALRLSGLANFTRGGAWVGVHPKIAQIYMALLAEKMAHNLFSPVTDSAGNSFLVSGGTPDRLAHVLLPDAELAPPKVSEHEVQELMASVALRSVIPKDIAHIPVEKIIELRRNKGAELAAFQGYVKDLSARLATKYADIGNKDALGVLLEAEYEKTLKPQLDSLESAMNSLGIKAAVGALNVQVKVPAGAEWMAAGSLGNPYFEAIRIGMGIVCTYVPFLQDQRRTAIDAVQAHPAAYLMHAQENLQPATLGQRVRRVYRKAMLGV